MNVKEIIREHHRKIGSKGGRAQKKKVSRKQLSEWGRRGAKVHSGRAAKAKEANAAN